MSVHPLLLLTAVATTGLLLMYAAQTGLGRWQPDEFRYFTAHRALGWNAYIGRLYVSPRPLSELLIYLYGFLVLQFNQDFVPAALLTLWGASVLAMLLAAWTTLRPSPFRLSAALSLATAPMVFVLQTNPVTEMFYWPAATVAYLPAVAGASVLLFLLGGKLTPRRRLWCGLALLASATSHEIGAALAIGLAAAHVVWALVKRRSPPASTDRKGMASELWWTIPGTVGLAVMAGLVVFRSSAVDLGSDTKPYTGRLLASACVALWQMLLDVGSTGYSTHDLIGIGQAVAQKSLFAAGFALVWLRWARVRPGPWHVALACGLGVAAFFSLFAAYYHYGDLCCERQATARHWLIDLMFILAAVAILARWQVWRTAAPGNTLANWLGPVALLASLSPVMTQIPAISSDFRLLAMAQNARARTWASGLARDGGEMRFYLPPDNAGMLIHGTSVQIGTFNLAAHPADLIDAVGRFFGKTVVTTCQAWQTTQSFLIDGHFIPACPPHDGPPDLVFNTGQH